VQDFRNLRNAHAERIEFAGEEFAGMDGVARHRLHLLSV